MQRRMSKLLQRIRGKRCVVEAQTGVKLGKLNVWMHPLYGHTRLELGNREVCTGSPSRHV